MFQGAFKKYAPARRTSVKSNIYREFSEMTMKRGFDKNKPKIQVPLPQMEGIMWKRSPAFHHKWQQRWFKLHEKVIVYYKNASMSQMCGSLDITNCTLLRTELGKPLLIRAEIQRTRIVLAFS